MDSMAVDGDVSHQAISSYFIGPRAENLEEFRNNITTLLDELQKAREMYFSDDIDNGYEFIPQHVRDSCTFKSVTAKFAKAVKDTAKMLGQHSIPFWSPRYQAHMCTDLSMPAMLGYLMAMIYNPNNVALEASPLSTVAEIEVGEQLCQMFGYNTNPSSTTHPVAWGHVTSRNLKFYPLSLRKAMDDLGGPLRDVIPEAFSVRTCQGKLKRFRNLTTWELLNLKPKTVLDIPEQLHDEFGISPEWLSSKAALDPYNIQTTGKDVLEDHFGVDSAKPGQYCVLEVDNAARVDVNKLEEVLSKSLAEQRPVYSVVAVIGSTEEGAVDPLHKILALRQKFQAQGLSFILSAVWAALTKREDIFTCVPFNALPAEASGSEQLVEDEKERIRAEVLSKTNAQIVEHDQNVDSENKTMTLLRALGSDLNINAFALNWRYPDGRLNTDVEEANYLMTRVVQRLSVDSPNDKPTDIPLYLTSTTFSDDLYGHCAANFRRRLGLQESDEPLMVLRNVVMSPLATFSTKGDFIDMLGRTFRKIVNEEVKIVQARNDCTADYHSFWTRGTDQVYLSYRQMFHMAKHRRQIILAVEFDEEGSKAYHQLKGNTEDELVVKTSDKIDLIALLRRVTATGKTTNKATFRGNLTTKTNGVIVPRILITVTSVLKDRPLDSPHHDMSYPISGMPFYLYGSPEAPHIDHILVRCPNIVLSAGLVTLNVETGTDNNEAVKASMTKGAILSLDGVHEAAMQPFEAERINGSRRKDFFFRPGASFSAKVWEDPRGAAESGKGLVREVMGKNPLATGEVVLGDEVLADVEKVNRDPFERNKDKKMGRIKRQLLGQPEEVKVNPSRLTFRRLQAALAQLIIMQLLTWASLLSLAFAATVIEPQAAQLIPGSYVVKLKDGVSENALQNTLRHVKVGNYKHVYRSGSFKGFAAKLSPQVLDFVQKLPEVEYIEQDSIVTVNNFITQTDGPWGLGRISHRAAGVSSYVYDSTAGEGTCAYIIDTGIYVEHSQFAGRATFLSNFVDNSNTDGNGHGTHVAGTIGGSTYGVAKKTQLFAVKVLSASGSGTLSGVLAGIDFVAADARNRTAAGQCPKGVVANMSLGSRKSNAVNAAVASAVNGAGVFFAVAAGNSDDDARWYSPASEQSACVDVESSWIGGPEQTYIASGTSMASPHIAGLGAYLLALLGPKKPVELCQYIKGTATLNAITDLPNDTFNGIAFNGNPNA
ncbi:hypothetical protein N0V88_007612 [Collariella sp. IMI 366227]|nr:hypothetical protein N0V88_007612 [Collariella sp. IMI 366227]